MKLKKCIVCGRYTLKDFCICGGRADIVKPPRFSPEDKYGGYRRKLKKEVEK